MSQLETSLKETDKLCSDLQTQINDTLQNTTSQHERLDATVLDLSTKTDNMKQKINSLEQTLDSKCNVINKLESTVNDLEQYSRRNCLRILGVPQLPQENTDEVVQDVARKIGVTLSPADNDRSHRVGKQPTDDRKSRGIIVIFTTYSTRQKFLQNRRRLKGTDTTIHEDLTSKNRDLLLKAQEHEKVTSAWTIDGRVFILIPANNGNSIKRLIKCKEDLTKL